MPQAIPPIAEQNEDSFTQYNHDPRLIIKSQKEKKDDFHSPLLKELTDRLRAIKDEEKYLDEIRYFKREKQKLIMDSLENHPLENRKKILNKLSEIAETIVCLTQDHIQKRMERDFGLPTYLSSYKQTQISNLSIIGMGKLGGGTINYHSDLDLIFVYSHTGETQGRHTMSNNEYFAKLAQRFINTLSVMTQAGRCYEIDTELRPSGNQGTLVTSYDHFIDHQMNKAQNWERQALIRARPITGESEFRQLLSTQIRQLVFERPLPIHFTKTMHEVREMVIQEKVKTSETSFDFKRGHGAIMDVEFILHHIQLKNARVFPDLKLLSLFDVLDQLRKHNLIASKDLETLTEAHLYYRTIESLSQIIKNRSITKMDYESDLFSEISERLKFKNKNELKEKIIHLRNAVRSIYEGIYA